MTSSAPVPPSPDLLIASLARSQLGLVSREQALEAGLSRHAISRRLEKKRWEQALPRVYRVSGTPESWHQFVLATCLWAGPSAVASHRTAAELWGLHLRPSYSGVEVTIPDGRRLAQPDITLHRNRHLLVATDIRIRDGIPVTSPARTLLDLASTLDRDTLELLLEEVLRRRLAELAQLRQRLDATRRRGRPGVRLLDELLSSLERVGTPLDSRLELRVLQVLRRAGLPDPVRHYPIEDEARRAGIVDFAYPDRQLAIEVDGPHHQGRRQWLHDQDRSSRLAAMGWRVIHVTTESLRRSDEVIEWVRSGLE